MLSLAAGTVLDADPAELVLAAADAGFDACGLRVDPATISTDELDAVAKAVDRTGLRLLDLEVIRMRSGPVTSYRPLLDTAAQLGAQWVLTVTEIADERERIDRLGELTALATRAGVGMSLEFMAFTALRTLADAVAAVTAVPECRILVDALHLARTGGTAADVAAAAHLLSYVQLCDAPSMPPRGGLPALSAEARHDRLLPGAGELDLAGLVRAVPAGLPLSVEVQSDRLAAELPVRERAAAAYRATRTVLAGLDAAQARPGGSARGT
jgi:sugar phosphate isomerase/epimerase